METQKFPIQFKFEDTPQLTLSYPAEAGYPYLFKYIFFTLSWYKVTKIIGVKKLEFIKSISTAKNI